MIPIANIRLAFDSGWSDGDPGDGRLRFDTPKLRKAKFAYINAKAADESLLDELVPTWDIGGVLVIERSNAPGNRVVAWIIGKIFHGGSYYKVPIAVRSVMGSFAAHDDLTLQHYADEPDGDEAVTVAPPDVKPLPRITSDEQDRVAKLQTRAPDEARTEFVAQRSDPMVSNPVNSDELAALRQENAELHGVLNHLLTDNTKLLIEDL